MIPIFNLGRQYESIKAEINSALLSVVRKGYFTLGQEVVKFEKKFAKFIGAKYAIGVASGTDALTLSLRALGVTAQDEVIVPANSYPSAFGLSQASPKLRLVDVDNSGNMDPEKLAGAITKNTKAVVPVHLYGNPANITVVLSALKSNKYGKQISIIEDCAQAHGATIGGKKVGSFGVIGCFSFYPTKNLGAYGDGGMLVTNNKHIASNLRALRMYGETSRYHSTMISGVSRLDELQAAVLSVKLKYLASWNAKRRKIAEIYRRELTGTGDLLFVPPYIGKNAITESANHLFVIRTKKRDELMSYLAKKGIQTAIHYPAPIHLAKSFRFLGYKKSDFPFSEALSNEVISLPLFPELTDGEQRAVIMQIQKFFK